MSELKSSIFGDEVNYYRDGKSSLNLPSLIKEKGFDDFSKEGITSFFTFRYPIGSHTMFRQVRRVPFGCGLEDNKKISEWQPKFSTNSIDFDSAIIRIEELILSSIKKLTEGKGIAIPLSGGVDSSLIVAMCKRLFPNEDIHTYSAGFYGDDEFEYSRIIAKKFNTIHKEKILYKEDYIGESSLLRPLIRLKGEPLHPNEIALANVEKMAKEDSCKIAMCGEGADDIFGGYGQNLRMYLNFENNQPFFKFFLDNYRYFSIEDRKKLVRDEYLIDDFELLYQQILNLEEMPNDLKNQIFYFIQKAHTPGLITRGANAMRFNSLKLGFPYTNKELVEFVNSLPFEYKVKWKSRDHKEKSKGMNFRKISEEMDIPKYILKKLAEKYLPEKIIYRPKYGFPVPFDKWFGDLKEWDLNQDVFKTKDISFLNGWKKFMVINLNAFIEEFNKYKKN